MSGTPDDILFQKAKGEKNKPFILCDFIIIYIFYFYLKFYIPTFLLL